MFLLPTASQAALSASCSPSGCGALNSMQPFHLRAELGLEVGLDRHCLAVAQRKLLLLGEITKLELWCQILYRTPAQQMFAFGELSALLLTRADCAGGEGVCLALHTCAVMGSVAFRE